MCHCKRVTLTALICTCMAAPAWAVMPDHGIFGDEVGDHVLADMRGKFVDGSQWRFLASPCLLHGSWRMAPSR